MQSVVILAVESIQFFQRKQAIVFYLYTDRITEAVLAGFITSGKPTKGN